MIIEVPQGKVAVYNMKAATPDSDKTQVVAGNELIFSHHEDMGPTDKPSSLRLAAPVVSGVSRMFLTQGAYDLKDSPKGEPAYTAVDEDVQVLQQARAEAAAAYMGVSVDTYVDWVRLSTMPMGNEPVALQMHLLDYQKRMIGELIKDGKRHLSMPVGLERLEPNYHTLLSLSASARPRFTIEPELGISRFLRRVDTTDATTVDIHLGVGNVTVVNTKAYGTRERRKQVVPKVETQIVNSNPKRKSKRKAKKGKSR